MTIKKGYLSISGLGVDKYPYFLYRLFLRCFFAYKNIPLSYSPNFDSTSDASVSTAASSSGPSAAIIILLSYPIPAESRPTMLFAFMVISLNSMNMLDVNYPPLKKWGLPGQCF